MEKLKTMIRTLWEKYSDAIPYLVFGVLTTVLNFALSFLAYNYLELSGWFSETLGWVVAAAFAFLTNKPFVFKSHDWSRKVVITELTQFFSCRVASGVMQIGIMFLTVDMLGRNWTFWKLLTSVLVVILNYFGSKLLVFRKK